MSDTIRVSERFMNMLWVILPAYNEEQSLPLLLPKINETLQAHYAQYRIVVVDDGSSDATAVILQRFKDAIPLDVVSHPLNRGLGETERDGFEYVASRCGREDLIVRVEGDDTHDPSYILALMEKLHTGFDVVNTSRFQAGGGQLGLDNYRVFISRCANIFMKLVFPITGVRDFSCGFRAYRASVIQDAIRIFGNDFIQLRGMGFTSTLEMIVKLDLLGCRFAEVPFVLRYDRKKSGSKMVGSITTIGYLLMAFLYHWPFGGWKGQYRGLRDAYRRNPAEATELYKRENLRRRTASRINI